MIIKDRPILEHMDVFHKKEVQRVFNAPWITLGPSYIKQAYELGVKRTESYNEHGGDTPMGRPIEFVMTDGVVGEMGVGIRLGWSIDSILEVIDDGADPGYDFDTEYGTVNVKASKWRRPYLLVKDSKKYQSDIFLLTHLAYETIDGEIYAKLKLLGFASDIEVANSPASVWPNDEFNRIMFWTELHPVEELGDTFLDAS